MKTKFYAIDNLQASLIQDLLKSCKDNSDLLSSIHYASKELKTALFRISCIMRNNNLWERSEDLENKKSFISR